MKHHLEPKAIPPFPGDYRASGVLLHITSLPSRYGVGDVGPSAFAWIDRLHETGQTWWQSLPIGPTGHGDSPYQALSSFAGNGLLISPEILLANGLLPRKADVPCFPADAVDYGAVIRFKQRLLDQAWEKFQADRRRQPSPAYREFCDEQAYWLEDYALFRALKEKYGGRSFLEWPTNLMIRNGPAIARARKDLSKQIDKICFAQFLILRQVQQLKKYANAKRIRLIGDLPFFVSMDSSDLWAHPELFLLDEQYRPRFVAGVPPDYFSADGQLWGNPVYDWKALHRTGFRFWLDRVRALLTYVDVIRLDHFRAFAAAWHVPADAKTARNGQWVPGPGAEFFEVVQKEMSFLPFIAEDLGMITPDVCELRDRFRIPGTRVLQFAFDGNSENPHLPRNYPSNAIAYTGTHDNDTTRGWFESLPENQRAIVRSHVGHSAAQANEVTEELLRLVWSSGAALAIAPIQDILSLGSEARMNEPGSPGGNWRWRASTEMLSDAALERLRDLTAATGRSSVPGSAASAGRYSPPAEVRRNATHP